MKINKILPLLHSMMEHGRSYSNLGSDYSTTELIQPPRIVQLKHRYKDKLNKQWTAEVITKQLASFRGTAIHDRFEKCLYWYMSKHQDTTTYLLEKRLWDKIEGRRISGKFDAYLDKVMYDFKTCSVWKKIFAKYQEWEEQLNIYSYLLTDRGVPVEKLGIIAWYMDWDKFKVFERGYPKEQIELIDIPLWERGKQRDFLVGKVRLHADNEDVPDEMLPVCTPEERWEKASAWAVYKVKEGKPLPRKASRVLPSEVESDAWMAKNMSKLNSDEQYKKVFRPGQRLRCEEYCEVNPFCDVYQEYKDAKT